MRRVLLWKRLLIVVAVVVVVGGVVFAVHRVQANRQASVIKARAEAATALVATDPNKRAEAIALYERYLKFRPDDESAFLAYATLLLELAGDEPEPAVAERVADGVEKFLRAFPNHPEERKKLARIYIQLGKLTTAHQHIEMVFNSPTGSYRTNIEVLEMAATCEEAPGGDITKAIGYLEDAINTQQAPVRVYERAMALHYANKGDPRRNTHIASHLDALLNGERFRNDLTARITAARFQLFLGEVVEARRNILFALNAIPGGADNPDALLAAAELELKEITTPEQAPVQWKKAETHLQKAFARDNKNVAVGILLAEVLARQGKIEAGVKVLRTTAEALGKVNDQYLVVIDRLIDLNEQELSVKLVDRLATHNKKPMVAYYRARLALIKQEWQTALKLFEEAAPHLAILPMYHKKALVGIAACYSAMQNPDKQLEYCRLARRVDGGYPLAVIGEAEALARMGKVEEALKRYRAIVSLYRLTDYRADLVRLELLDMLVRPIDTRDWTRFEESLGPVESRTADIHMLHAESLAARGKLTEAVKLLKDWLAAEVNKDNPKRAAVWVTLSRLSDGGKFDSAWALLDAAEKQVGDRIEFRLAKAGLLVVRPNPPAPAEFDALGANASKFTKSEQFRLWFGLGQAAGRLADRLPDGEPVRALRSAALNYLRTAADLFPMDLTCRAVLVDYGLAAGRMDVVERALQEMKAIEGEDGPVGNLGRIAVRLPDVKKLTDATQRASAVKELREMARRVRELRPGWTRVYVALGQLDEIEGLNDSALANYREAIDKGERQEFVIRRTIDLLRDRKLDDEAVGRLNKLSLEIRLPDDLERYRVIRKLFTDLETIGIPKNERPTLDRIAPATSDDPRLQMLRGELLAVIREDAESLKAFRRAVEVRNGDRMPETWAALVAELMRHNKVDDAKRAVLEAEKKLTPEATKLNEADRLIAIGTLYEAVGDTKTARERYEAAYRIAPLELNPTRQLVRFYQRTGQMEKANALLREAKDSIAQDIARWARRHLAITMIGRADAYNLRHEALRLVEQNLAVAPDDAEDVKTRAVIWTVDPVTREEGIRVLRQFGDRAELTPEEFYLLGRLAFDQGKYFEAEKYFKLAARIRPGVTPEHMAALVRVYVALNLFEKAQFALERLKTTAPNSWEAVREEARLLYRRSKAKTASNELAEAKKLLEQAREVILKFPGWDSGANLIRAGSLFEELGFAVDAEVAYKKFMSTSELPNAHVPLAIFYIRQKQPEKAIQLARDREEKVPVELTAQLLSGAVRMKRPGATIEADIEKWLDDQLPVASGNARREAALIGAKAEILDAQGKYAEAIKEYERAIAKHKSDMVVNNLCMLLALSQPKRADDAVKMMSELIAIRGPVPAFLDTRAVAYLVSSRPMEAIKDLEMALVQFDRATYRFHLAWAIDLNALETKRVFAVDELKKAKQMGLSADDLHPLELETYQSLLAKYKQ